MDTFCKICSVQISEKKGTVKYPVDSIELDKSGIVGDAHAGNWNRQVSILAKESITRFEEKLGRKISYGEFAENITTEGLEIHTCNPLDIFTSGEVTLQVTQIGKKCHGDNCEIFQQVGSCVMPKEGIFCKVIKGGTISNRSVLTYKPYTISIKIITLSDRASRGEYVDLSGPKIKEIIEKQWNTKYPISKIDIVCIPDSAELLETEIENAANKSIDIIFTTGGTGIGPRDITVDVVKELVHKEIPGIMEFIRYKYGVNNPKALLSRSIAGTINKTLIFTLPGSINGVVEYMNEILQILEHTFFMLQGIDTH